MLKKQIDRTSTNETHLLASIEAMEIPQSLLAAGGSVRRNRQSFGIDKGRIGEYAAHMEKFFENLYEFGQFLREPNVILMTEREKLS
jgi:hypothetical protein